MSTNARTDDQDDDLPPWLPDGIEFVDRDHAADDLPDHIQPIAEDNHDGVCMACGKRITISPNGTEYGHARRNNRCPDLRQKLGDCRHRPTSRVDPKRETNTGGSA